jgi:alkyl hydroperoxide reductase subunit D
MSIETLKAALPPYARDIGSNLSAIAAEIALTEQQKWGAFVAAAHAIGEPATLRAVDAEATAAGLSAAARTAAKAAAAIMGLNNIYFRALHLMENTEYQRLPARLRRNLSPHPGVDKADFELWEFVVSAIHGCGACLDAHEAELRKLGVSPAAILSALRIASVVHAAARALAAEAAWAAPPWVELSRRD